MSTQPIELNAPPNYSGHDFVGDGVIAAMHGTTDTLGGKATGLATGISYDVTIELASGGTVTFASVKPNQPREDCMIYPTAVGTPVDVKYVGGQFSFQCIETVAWKACT